MKKINKCCLSLACLLGIGGIISVTKINNNFQKAEAAKEDVELAKLTAADMYANRTTGTYGKFSWGVTSTTKELYDYTSTSVHVPAMYSQYFYVRWDGSAAEYPPNKATFACTIEGDVGSGFEVNYTRNGATSGGYTYGQGDYSYTKVFSKITKKPLYTSGTGTYDFVLEGYMAGCDYTINNLSIIIYGEKETYKATIMAGTGIESVFLSTDENATSGSASGTSFPRGTKVYGFAVLKEGYRCSNSSWVLVSGTADTAGAIYRIGSKTLNSSDQSFGTATSNVKQKIIDKNLQGGTGVSSIAILNYGSTANLGTPTRKGYAFLGWNSKSDGTGTEFNTTIDVETVNSIVLGNTEIDAFYAQWEQTGTLITLDKQGGTGGSNDTLGVKDTVLEDIQVPAKSGYTFNGYFEQENGQGTKYYDESGKSTFTWTSEEVEATFYASWTIKEAVQDTIDKINAIGEVKYPDSKDKIEAARSVFDALSPEDVNGVNNYATLTDAELEYSNLRQQGVDDVELAINAIGEVTLEKENDIIAARAAYNALTDEQKDMVDAEVLAKLVAAENRLAELKTNKAAGDNVVNLINAIGEVKYPDSKDAIKAARDAYDALTNDEQRGFVTNYAALTDAEEEYDNQKLAGIAAVESLINNLGEFDYDDEDYVNSLFEAKGAFDDLTEEQQALVSNKDDLDAALAKYKEADDKAAAKLVDDLIDDIGEVTYPDSEGPINVARTAYDNLTDDQKALVNKLQDLEDAEEQFANLKAVDEVVQKINAIPNPVVYTPECKALIDEARAAYNALSDEQKGLVAPQNLSDLINAENDYEVLKKDNEAADKVKASINNIGNVEYTQESKNKIDAARAAYDALTEEQKALVTNYSTLTRDEEVYAHVQTAVEKIEGIGDVNLNGGDEINVAKEAYDSLNDEEKALILTYHDTLLTKEQTYTKLVHDHKVAVTCGIVFGILGGLILLVGIAYVLLMFVFNKWIKEGDKAVRVLRFALGSKDGKQRYLAFPCKFAYRNKEEVFNTKEDALK